MVSLTRLHPQGKGGPKVILCDQHLKNIVKKVKRHLQNGSKNRQLLKDRPFSSRGLFVEKSAFLTGRVLRDVGMFLQN